MDRVLIGAEIPWEQTSHGGFVRQERAADDGRVQETPAGDMSGSGFLVGFAA